jgi:phosphoenolpyruvate carboxykinase (ATP)
MHCSANIGSKGDVALYFGLSGTGKTTLSSTPDRQLIGDDEHGWGDNGVFNFEGGCYAKTIRLSAEHEPVIWQASNQYGAVLENVVIDPVSRVPDFNDSHYTENTRAAYPLTYVDNIVPGSQATHPTNVFFLTADAFGVMPPIARLNRESAIYYFLSGYTSKVAGTERGLGQQPSATFSTCFGEPFLPLTPNIYAKLLKQKLEKHQSNIWLVNTGWTGGDYNSGYRMPLPHTRKMLNWILSGEHVNASYHQDQVFNLDVPNQINGVPTELLYPEQNWKDKKAFEKTSHHLKQAFEENFIKFKSFI